MRTWQRRIKAQSSTTIKTAQDFTFDLPRDHFIHEIHITVYETSGLAGTTHIPKDLQDHLLFIQLVGNGNKVLKYGTGDMFKQVMLVNKRNIQTGLYTLFFSDPHIPDAKPLPSWVFTSLTLTLTDQAPIVLSKHYIEIVVTESAYENQDLSSWRVLIEKYLKWQKYGTNTGEQDYEHERAYKVFGYIYTMDDNGVLSDLIFDYVKLLGRKPEGEVTIVDVPIALLEAENNSEVAFNHLTAGYVSLQWLRGFPANEFASLYSKPNIPAAGTNAGLRVLERYVL